MEFGLTIPHTGRHASPEWVREYCVAAEDAGWDSLWAVDHLVMPHHTDSKYTLGRTPAAIGDDAVSGLLSPNYEMMTTLTWVAGFTRAGEARHLGGGVADPQRSAQRPTARHPRRVLGWACALRGRCRLAPRRGRGDGHAVGPPGSAGARSTSRSSARCGAPRATSSSSTVPTTRSRRWTPSPARCSDPSRSSWGATPTSRSNAPGASATAGSRPRCRPSAWPSTGPRCWRRPRGTDATPRRCSSSRASRAGSTSPSANCWRSTATSASTTSRSGSTGSHAEETLDTIRDVAENVLPRSARVRRADGCDR